MGTPLNPQQYLFRFVQQRPSGGGDIREGYEIWKKIARKEEKRLAFLQNRDILS